jgi:metallo-beta-lactamase class B
MINLAFLLTACLTLNPSVSPLLTTFASYTQPINTPEYESENLIINKLSDHVYQHISYLNTDSFGRVACNGMIVVNGNEAVVFDTPATNETSEELIGYLTEKQHLKIKGIVATHFHADCVGGLEAFHQKGVPSYAENRTIASLKETGSPQPQKGFDSKLTLKVGNKKVYATYLGEGHTRDNVVGYFPEDNALFGGCLIKEVGASKGYLGDANVQAWPETVRKVKARYPQAKIVIPGHGKVGGTELLDFTVKLFE